MIESRHLSAYIGDPSEMRFGYSDPDKAAKEIKANRINQLGEIKLQRIISSWKVNLFKSNGLKQLELSLLLQAFKQLQISCAFKDLQYRKPTNYSLWYWSNKSYKETNQLELDSLSSFSGVIGSLAFFTATEKVETESLYKDPWLGIKEIIKAFWENQKLDSKDSARSKIELVLSKIKYDKSYLDLCEQALLEDLDRGSLFWRRNGLNSNSFKNLFLRFLLGELDSKVLNELDRVAVERKIVSAHKSIAKPSDILKRLLCFGGPGGFALLLNTLIVEALVETSLILRNLNTVNLEKNSFFLSQKYLKEKQDVARNLQVASEASYLLTKFNTLDSANLLHVSLKRLLLQFMSAASIESTDDNLSLPLLNYKLSTKSIESVLDSIGTEPSIEIFPATVLNNSSILTLKAKDYFTWDKLDLELLLSNPESKLKAVNVWVVPLSQEAKFMPVRVTLITNQIKNLTLQLEGSGLGSAIAILSDSSAPPIFNNQENHSNSIIYRNFNG